MQLARFALTAALASALSPAQTASDVGLMMDGGMLTVIYGQSCGPFTCQPFQAGPAAAGQPYNVYVSGAPSQPFALAADLSSVPCVTIPGIANSLLLLGQPVTLAFGMTSSANLTGVCNQGRGQYVLQLPLGTPTGIPFTLQGAAISSSLSMPAFTVAIRSVTS